MLGVEWQIFGIFMMLYKKFTATLMEWHLTQNNRQMPWKGEKDPYKIWLSEVILQQTRVEQGRTYYENFTHKYPTVAHLAAAPERGRSAAGDRPAGPAGDPVELDGRPDPA